MLVVYSSVANAPMQAIGRSQMNPGLDSDEYD